MIKTDNATKFCVLVVYDTVTQNLVVALFVVVVVVVVVVVIAVLCCGFPFL